MKRGFGSGTTYVHSPADTVAALKNRAAWLENELTVVRKRLASFSENSDNREDL
jgi:hypothetical protein